MFGKPKEPLDRLREIASAYDPRDEEADTMQGLLADAILMLRSEANRNGWQNWGENYEECVSLLLKYLCYDGTAMKPEEREQMQKDLEAIREAGQTGADHGRMAYEAIDRAVLYVLRWCEAHPKPIHKPPGEMFWM